MKAKNGKSLSARCAGACVGANVPTRVGERDECVGRVNRTGTKGGAQSEREGVGAQKERARRRNKGRMERKSASFRPQTVEFEMHELFIARKVGFIERKCLSLLPKKRNISLFLPQYGVHIAQNRGLFPVSRRKRSLTSTYSQLYSARYLDRCSQ